MALKLEKVVLFDTCANYRRKRARRLKFWLLIEDEWNLIVSEYEVDRVKTLGIMAILLRKNEKPDLFRAYNFFPRIFFHETYSLKNFLF